MRILFAILIAQVLFGVLFIGCDASFYEEEVVAEGVLKSIRYSPYGQGGVLGGREKPPELVIEWEDGKISVFTGELIGGTYKIGESYQVTRRSAFDKVYKQFELRRR